MRLRDFLRMWWRVKVRPSPLQKEFNRGDPDGIVKKYAELLIAEMEAEDRKGQA